jgi:penicillin-binding protein 1A
LAYGISEVKDSGGRVIYRRSGSGPGPVIAPELVGLMNEMLSGVISHGTGKAAALPRPVAGKTGTTQDYRDAWFIGYTADLVAGIWLGNDDNSPMNRVTGGSLPAVAWRSFMLAATKGMPVRSLPTPEPEPAPEASPPAVASAGATTPAAAPAQPGGSPLDLLFGLFSGPARTEPAPVEYRNYPVPARRD